VLRQNPVEKVGGEAPPPFPAGFVAGGVRLIPKKRRSPARKLHCVTENRSSILKELQTPDGPLPSRENKSDSNVRSMLGSYLWKLLWPFFWRALGRRREQKTRLNSAELKGARTLLRIRTGIFDFEPDLGLKLGRTKPEISGTVPTNRNTTVPNESGPISASFDDDPKLLN
jgi:hypothetical protein